MSTTVSQNIFAYKAKAFYDITKFRLSSTVVFSGAFGFIIASDKIDWIKVVSVLRHFQQQQQPISSIKSLKKIWIN